MVVASEGKPEGESEGRLVADVRGETKRLRAQRESKKERRMNEETEVEEDNIDPLVAPPLLAQPTPSLYYPPSLRLRFPTYAHTYTISRNSRNHHARVFSKRGSFENLREYRRNISFILCYSSSLFRQFLNISVTSVLSFSVSFQKEGDEAARRSTDLKENSWRVSRKSCEDCGAHAKAPLH